MDAGIGHNNDYNLTLGQSTTISDAYIVVIGTLQVGHEDWLEWVDHLRHAFSVEVNVFVGFLVPEAAVAAAAEGQHLAVVVEDVGVDSSGGDLADLVVDCFYLARLGLVCGVLVAPFVRMAQLTFVTSSPSVHLSGFRQSHAVGVLLSSRARGLDYFYVS